MTNTAPIDAVAELIRTQKLRIDITPAVGYWVKAPCLLTQLRNAIAGGMETGGRGIPTSRPPIAVDALDLWREIGHNTHSWAAHMGLNRRDRHPHSQTPWIGRLLRSCAAQAISTGKPLIADRIEHDARRWTAQITAMLTGQAEQRSIRGAACPTCTQRTIIEDRAGDGTYRVPAIILVTRDTLRWLVCQACGWTDPVIGGNPELVYSTGDMFDDAGPAVV